MKRLVAFVFLVSLVGTVHGALLVSVPTEVCGLLKEVGLSTGGWKNAYDDEFGCSSPYKDIGSGSPLANNLAFYAEGGRTTATLVKLVLNINVASSATAAHDQLLEAASALSIKVTGTDLPPSLKAAIRSGGNATESVGSASVDVLRMNWRTGRGYELHVVIR